MERSIGVKALALHMADPDTAYGLPSNIRSGHKEQTKANLKR